jgi:hypothetical protein
MPPRSPGRRSVRPARSNNLVFEGRTIAWRFRDPLRSVHNLSEVVQDVLDLFA